MSPSFLPVACALAVLASVTGAAGHEGLEEAVSLLQRFQSLEDNGHRTPVIIDTDADTDDQMAIAFVLAQPDIEVLAITVGCDGWSQQWAGVVSVMRLTQYFGQPDIPVAYSPFYNSDTQLNLKEPNKLPNPRLQTGLGNFLSQHVGLPFNMRPPSWMYTGLLLQETLRRSRRKVNVIALGPLTNLAHFLQESPRLFERKVDRIYFSGGIVVPRSSSPTDKVWPYSAPDTSFTGNPPGTEWNVFSDPVAANSVFSFGKSLVLATSTYTEGMRFFLNDTDFIPASCDGDRAAVLTKLVTTLSVAANEAPEDLRYWDESAVVLFVQMIRNGGKQEAAVCVDWDAKRFSAIAGHHLTF
ncbi:URH1 [Symbiodinium natans]|uniref:URH1 protein n=1 Tax=Symbiodinium natans TaxID=878477 RepID=A0A812RXD7_9DINO|nr:URH1 [Symbiodinium natans]